jgi:hypothetical protein
LIIIYEHLKSKPGDIKPKKNIKKETLEEMSMKWIYWRSEKLKEIFLISFSIDALKKKGRVSFISEIQRC